MATKTKGKNSSKSAASKASNIQSATTRVKTKTSISFARSVRGK